MNIYIIFELKYQLLRYQIDIESTKQVKENIGLNPFVGVENVSELNRDHKSADTCGQVATKVYEEIGV